jgi:hypothetical protein
VHVTAKIGRVRTHTRPRTFACHQLLTCISCARSYRPTSRNLCKACR